MASRAPDRCDVCGRPLSLDGSPCSRCAGSGLGAERSVILEGKWVLEAELGRGGMGTVFLARDLELERKVAIKMLGAELARDAEVVARFEREARILAKLEHPNLVPIFAVGRHEGRPFIVMKKLEGMTLADYLRDHGPLAVDDLLYVTGQVCAGLSLMHARGVIHRDLKPSNVFLGTDGHVTILDLGVAHDSRKELTRAGMLIGTPRYMSPEQIRGKGGLDGRADLYVLAAVVYELATGTPLYGEKGELQVMGAHLREPAPDIRERLPELPQAFSAELRRALSKEPADRHATVETFFAALADAVGLGGAFQVRRDFTPRPQPSTFAEHGPSSLTLLPSDTLRKRLSRTDLDAVAAPPADTVTKPRGSALRHVPAPSPTSAPPRRVEPGRAVAATFPEVTSGTQLQGPAPRPRGLLALALSVCLAGAGTLGWFALRGAATPLTDAPGTGDEPFTRRGQPPAAAIVAAGRATGVPVEKDERAAAAPTPRPSLSERGGASVASTSSVRASKEKRSRTRSRRGERSPAEGTPSLEVSAAAVAATATATAVAESEVRVVATYEGELSWAWLDVDGVRVGATPLTLNLEPGKHTLRFERAGFQSATRTVTVLPGEPLRVQQDLQR